MSATPAFAVQLYSARNFPPLADQLTLIAGLGYTRVEPFDGLYEDAPALRAALDAAGLAARSGHFGLSRLEADLPHCVGTARTLGLDTVVAPWLAPEERPGDVAGWQAVGARLRAVAARLKDEGLAFAWHNHGFEFTRLADGSFAIEHLIGGHVSWQADLAWVARTGADPLRWLQHFAGSVSTVHVKDIAPAGQSQDEDGWADVGEGIVPWPALWPAALAAGAGTFIAEHDNPNDFARFARRSMAAMRRLAQES